MSDWKPDEPFQQLPALPPQVPLETKGVLKQCIRARAALAELKQAVVLIPNPSMLINTLPVLEAGASSEIENIVTTTDELFKYQDPESASDAATKEALRYSRALYRGFANLHKLPLSTRLAEEVCSEIKGTTMTIRRIPGTAALGSSSTGRVIYTPPVGETLLREKLANWERYVHAEDDLDPLIRMAVSHYQFEAIHPFTDGNGRTGRILNSLYLIEKELLSLPVLYLSRYILSNRAAYNELLLEVTRSQDWEPWILYMLVGVEETAAWTASKIAAIRSLATRTEADVRKALPHVGPARELVDVIFEQPYCRIVNVTRKGIAKRQTASIYLKELVRVGILREIPVGREKLFVNTALLELLAGDARS